ncbi:MAG: hypothetical protein EBQ96_05005 [Proteobacteria bacterium]|nr:hypothetical protein [Pseudomonadota bacterium]
MRLTNLPRWRSLAMAGLLSLSQTGCAVFEADENLNSASFTCTGPLGTPGCFQGDRKKSAAVSMESGWRVVDTGDERRPTTFGYGVTFKLNLLNNP